MMAQQQLVLDSLMLQMAKITQQMADVQQQQVSAPPSATQSSAPSGPTQAPLAQLVPAPPALPASLQPFFPQVNAPPALSPPQLLTGLPPAFHPQQPVLDPAGQPVGPGLQPPPQPSTQAAAQQVSPQPTHTPLITAGSASIFGPAYSFSSTGSAPAPAASSSPPETVFSLYVMPKAMAPIVHAESETAPRTQEALQAVLHTWIESVSERLRGSPQWEQAISALWRYVNKTLQFAMEAGVQNAVNYHRAACTAALHSPPLYDPLVHGDVARYEHLIHIAPYVRGNNSGRSPTSRKRNRPAAASPDSTATSPQPTRQTANGPQRQKRAQGGADAPVIPDQCTIHRGSAHTNARCNQQQRGYQPGAGAAPATPVSARSP